MNVAGAVVMKPRWLALAAGASANHLSLADVRSDLALRGAAASARPRRPSFDKMRATWCSTVLRERNKRPAISGFESPSPSRTSTSCSRLVSRPAFLGPVLALAAFTPSSRISAAAASGVTACAQILKNRPGHPRLGPASSRRWLQHPGKQQPGLSGAIGNPGPEECRQRDFQVSARGRIVCRRERMPEQAFAVRNDELTMAGRAERDEGTSPSGGRAAITQCDLCFPSNSITAATSSRSGLVAASRRPQHGGCCDGSPRARWTEPAAAAASSRPSTHEAAWPRPLSGPGRA